MWQDHLNGEPSHEILQQARGALWRHGDNEPENGYWKQLIAAQP